MLEEIKPLHGMGFSIIWLQPKSKRPLEKGWTSGPRHEWETLKAFYKPSFNVGVRLGDASKLDDGSYLAAIDCDVKSSDPIHLLEMERVLGQLGFDWESAPSVRSGRGNGSRHIYIKTELPKSPFRIARSEHVVKVDMPSVLSFSKKEMDMLTDKERKQGVHIRPAWEISLMGTGQQCVLPPSIHPDSGLHYSWDRPIRNINDVPLAEVSAESLPGPKKQIKQAPEFQEVIVDLLSANIPDWAYDLIVSAKGLEKYNSDRSAALMAVTFCMINAQFTDLEIMSVLTDPTNELAWTAYEHRKTKDRRSAADWVYRYTITKARYEKSAQKAFEEGAEIEDQIIPEEQLAEQADTILGDWKERLDRNLQTGRLKNSLKNTVMILANCQGESLFYYDDFFHSENYASEPPWKDREEDWKRKEIVDADLARIKNWFGNHWDFEPSDGTIIQAIQLLSRKNTVHPVRDYLEKLRWDGKPRLDNWLKTYLKAEGPIEYLRAVGRKVLVACVARVMEPGCQWDHVVILEGDQGSGKSSTCKILSDPWFSSTLGDISNKDAVEGMRGNWIIELGELANMRKAEVETLKHFVTVRTDKIRKAYARKSEAFPRQCVFIGTTNRDDYLKDETGNRRFWPVRVGQTQFEDLIRDRDQIFAEAMEAWAEGERLMLEGAAKDMATGIQASRMDRDEWIEALEEILKADEFLVPDGFSLMGLWKRFNLGGDLDGVRFNQDIQKRMGRCLRILSYEKRHTEHGNRWFKKK